QEASGQAITKQPIISQLHSTPQSTRMPEYQIAHACNKQLLHCKASRSAMSVVGQLPPSRHGAGYGESNTVAGHGSCSLRTGKVCHIQTWAALWHCKE